MKTMFKTFWGGLMPHTRRVFIISTEVCMCLIMIVFLICATVSGQFEDVLSAILNWLS